MTTRAASRPAAGPGLLLAAVRRPRWPPVPVMARWFCLIWLATFVVLLINDPGQMVFDTKLSVDVNPSAYYASLWHLWDPQDTFGTLNNQAIGYAMPMAPFYLAGQLAHAPVWLTERLWLSLLVAVGAVGLMKLGEGLRIGSPASRLAAGLVFALWPTFTIVIGSTSAAVLPGMLAPWAVLPLVTARADSWRAVSWPAARSGVAVLCMGGVNATSTVDALILPGLFILYRFRGRQLPRIGLAWLAAIAAAVAWWALPLLLQGKYAFNFLPFVEQANTTTSTASAATALRGAGNWTAYLNFGSPWLPAGWTVVTNPYAIIASSTLAAAGLYGLAKRGMPAATWLRLAVAIAAAILLAGYAGALGGPLHQSVGNLLNGTLAPFRNVYKVEPVIATALALGIAHATAPWLSWANSAIPDWRQALGWGTRLAIGAALIGLALPYLSDQVLNPGPFGALPGYWQQAAGYLAARSPHNPALVVPADAHGDYLWGDPIDDPLLALATSPWVERSLVPYGGAGSQALLTTAEQAFESGERVPGLAAYLNRAGISYVVVRNDLNPGQIGYTSAIIVHQTLRQSGFSRVAAYGPPVTAAQTAPDFTPQFQAVLPVYPSVEIFAVPGLPAAGPAVALPAAQTVLVNGGPDSLLQLTGQGILGARQPAVIAGDPPPVRPATWAVTDGQRRADTAFGLVNANVSYTYTAQETNPVDDQLGGAGGPPRQLLPVAADGHQTVAVLSGAADVTASSYGAWLSDTQQEDPASVFDGNPGTAWAEGNPVTPVGQWIQIGFGRALSLPSAVRIRLLDDSPVRELASQVRVSTAAGSVSTALSATGAAQQLSVPAGPTTWLRITITAAHRVTPGGPGAGISDVLIPGVTVTRLLQPAESGLGTQAPSFSFSQQVPSLLGIAAPASTPPMARTFGLARPATYELRASALALPGSGLDAIMSQLSAPAKGELLATVASSGASASSNGSAPASFPAGVLNGTGVTPWIAGSANPVIHLRWQGKRRITSMTALPSLSNASLPATVKISSPAGVRVASVGSGGAVRLRRPLITDRMDISFPAVHPVNGVNAIGQATALPVGLARLSIPALADLRATGPDPRAPVTLGCGQGPALTIDGQTFQTTVTGTLGALAGYAPVRVGLCGGLLGLSAGQHTLIAASPGTFAVTDLSLTAPAAASAGGGPARAVSVGTWGNDRRQLTVGPGAQAYLEVHENYDRGWTATLGGRTLSPVRLDGWQQAFIVPAGAGGVVTLVFRPAATYRLVLTLSLVAIGLLLVLALYPVFPAIRRFRSATAFGPAAGGAFGPAAGAAVSARAWWLAVLGVTALIALTGGFTAVAVPVLAVVAWRRPRWLPLLAFVPMAAAGLITAAAASQPEAGGSGAFGIPAQACALIALAAALLPAGQATRPPGLVPDRRDGQQVTECGLVLRGFAVVDELSCYFDSRAEPNTVHMEVWLPDHLDVGRLRAAVQTTLENTPPAMIRRSATRWWRRSFTWEIPFPPIPDVEPVTVTSWRFREELEAVRRAFLTAGPPLATSPPFRLLLAAGPVRDCLILNAHHAAFDGRSCLLLLRAIADNYSGTHREPPPEPAAEDAQQPDPQSSQEASQEAQPPPAAAAPPPRRKRLPARVERITPVPGHREPRAPGYGVRLLEWPGIPATPVAPATSATSADGESPRATVNDLLITAFIATVRAWNATSERHQIRISMPVDMRSPADEFALGNLSRLSTVTVEPGTGDLLGTVAGQSAEVKVQPSPQVGLSLAAIARLRLPVAVKRLLLRAALRTVGRLLADTALVSNLGNVTEPPKFGQLEPEHIWFSPPAHMPRGVSLGAVSVGGRLHLCFRYRRALFDEHAAVSFANSYATHLRHLDPHWPEQR